MDYTAIIVACISGIVAVIVGYLQFKESKRQKADAKDHQALRETFNDAQEITRLTLRGVEDIGDLARITAESYNFDKKDNNVESALNRWRNYDREIKDYYERLSAKISGGNKN